MALPLISNFLKLMKNCKKVEKTQFWPIWSARIEAELRDWLPLNFASNEGKVFFFAIFCIFFFERLLGSFSTAWVVWPSKIIEGQSLNWLRFGHFKWVQVEFFKFFRNFFSPIWGNPKLNIELWFLGQSSLEWPSEFNHHWNEIDFLRSLKINPL